MHRPLPLNESETMDPKSPLSSSSPVGYGRNGRIGVPNAKRARLRYLDRNDDDRPAPTFKSSNDQICLDSADGKLVLPTDLLTSSLLYLDVCDLPSALAVCKDWRRAFQSVEDELWLGLVRKHCPAVEEITNLLELPPKKELFGSGSSIGSAISSDIPTPSKSWRRQFQRHLLLSKSDGSAASAAAEKPPPKPLSAYLFKVDLVLYQKKEGATGKGAQVGVVSRVFPDAKFNSNDDRIQFKLDGLYDDVKNYTFSTFDFRITIFDKGTGKQALIHSSGIEDLWDVNLWSSGYCPLKCAYVLDNLADGLNDHIESMFLASKTSGCVSRCDSADWDFYDKPLCSACCECVVKWSCFWDMKIDLRIAAFFEWDVIDLNEAQKLRFLEEHIEFK